MGKDAQVFAVSNVAKRFSNVCFGFRLGAKELGSRCAIWLAD